MIPNGRQEYALVPLVIFYGYPDKRENGCGEGIQREHEANARKVGWLDEGRSNKLAIQIEMGLCHQSDGGSSWEEEELGRGQSSGGKRSRSMGRPH